MLWFVHVRTHMREQVSGPNTVNVASATYFLFSCGRWFRLTLKESQRTLLLSHFGLWFKVFTLTMFLLMTLSATCLIIGIVNKKTILQWFSICAFPLTADGRFLQKRLPCRGLCVCIADLLLQKRAELPRRRIVLGRSERLGRGTCVLPWKDSLILVRFQLSCTLALCKHIEI